mgnify:FL=1
MLKRSLLYLRRKYKRSVLLLILLFVISFSLAVGVSVWGSIGAVTKEVQDRLGTSFIVKMNAGLEGPYETVKLKNGGTQNVYCGPRADRGLIEEIMQVDGVADYNAETYSIIYTEDFSPVPGGWAMAAEKYIQDWENNPEIMENRPEGELDLEDYQMWGNTARVYANSNTELYSNFRTGAFTLVDGRHIRPEDTHKALISEELAQENGLQVGDTITIGQRLGMVDGSARDNKMDSLGTIELEIVGIFHVNGYQPINRFTYENDIVYNGIMIDINTCEEYGKLYYNYIYEDYVSEIYFWNIVFFVDDPERLTEIAEEVKQLGAMDPVYFSVTEDDTMYKSTVDPLNSIRNLVAGLVAAIVVGCMVILLIVFTMWVRSRRQEVAIYLSLGFSKFRIIGQFVLEAVIVAVVALVIALPSSIPVANAVGNQMLTSAIEAAQPSQEEYSEEEILQAARSGAASELYQFDSSNYGGPNHIDFTFGLAEVLILVALELLIIVAAICKGGSFIFKLQPRQILTTLS